MITNCEHDKWIKNLNFIDPHIRTAIGSKLVNKLLERYQHYTTPGLYQPVNLSVSNMVPTLPIVDSIYQRLTIICHGLPMDLQFSLPLVNPFSVMTARLKRR